MSVVNIFNAEEKYNIIYADPPWQYKDNNCSGAAQKHYNTMKLPEICDLPINNIADKNCVLFLWATYPMLESAFHVIESWGFKYKTIGFQWIKRNSKTGGTSSG